MAYRSGTAEAPSWVSVLEAAREWGVTPWSITEGSPILWFERWLALREMRFNAGKD